MAKHFSGRYIKTPAKTALSIIIAVATAIVLLIVGASGKVIAENILLPLFGTAEQSVTPLPEGYKNGFITMPRLDIYTVQLCTFDDSIYASVAADELRNKGGAGYIFDDSQYRVLASGYTTEAQARSVANKQADKEYAPAVYLMSSGSVTFSISCSKENFAVLERACTYYPELLSQIIDETVELEKKSITQTAVRIKYTNRAGTLRQIIYNLEALPSSSDDLLITQLLTLYRNAVLQFEKISSENDKDNIDFFADIRYNYIEMVVAYCDAVENLS